ncbi:MAG: hypothetical protein RSC49_01070 [Clostridium sp.]
MANQIDKGINKVFTELQAPTVTPEDIPGTVIYRPDKFIYEKEATKTEGDYYFVANNKLASYKMIVGTDKSLWNQLKRVSGILPNGPYMMDSRDDGITIHNHKFNQSAKVNYTYAGGNGELLSIDIKTTKKTISVQATKSSQLDPKDKTVTTSISQSCSDDSNVPEYLRAGGDDIVQKAQRELWAAGGRELDKPKSRQILQHEERLRVIKAAKDEKTTRKNLQSTYEVTQEDVNAYLQQVKGQWSNLLNDARQSGNVFPLLKANSMDKMIVKKKVPVRMTVNPIDFATLDTSPNTAIPGHSQHDVSNSARRYGSGVRYLKSQPNIIVLPLKKKFGPGAQPWLEVIMDKEVEVELDGARIFAAASPQQIQNALSTNQLSDYTQKQKKCTMRVLGRPELESSMVIGIGNISKAYSGEWYTKKVKHIINSSGYTCSCELIMKSLPVSISQTTSVVNTKDIYSEFNKVAKKKIKSGEKDVVSDIKNEFKKISQQPGLKDKSLVVDMRSYKPSTGEIPVFPATEDQVNIAIEREKHRK